MFIPNKQRRAEDAHITRKLPAVAELSKSAPTQVQMVTTQYAKNTNCTRLVCSSC